MDFGQLISSRSSNVAFRDSGSVDSFGRVRASIPATLFEAQNQYGIDDHLFDSLTVGGASITHLPLQSSTQLTVGTDAGSRAVRQSVRYHRYHPGKGLTNLNSFVFGAQKSGVVKRVGYFNDLNGVFLEQSNLGVCVVRRSNTTGSVVDTKIPQNQWNLRKFDGTDQDEFSLDWTKAQLLSIDFEWLGVGRIRIGFWVNGILQYAHIFNHTNVLATVYMTTSNLPVRFEIFNSSTTVSTTSFTQICSAVLSESGQVCTSVVHQADTDILAKLVGSSLVPIISIRPTTLFNGISNTGQVLFTDFSLLVSGNNGIHFAVLKNPSLTGAVWTPQGEANSMVEYDITATSLSGGSYVFGGYMPAGGNKGVSEGFSNLEVYLVKHLNSSLDVLTLAAKALSGSTSVYASLLWKEIY